jgi:iron complex outermembrane recepter protein
MFLIQNKELFGSSTRVFSRPLPTLNRLTVLFFSSIFWLVFSVTMVFAQKQDTAQRIDLQPFTVTATMATNATPMTFTTLRKDQIRRNDFGQDVPYLLRSTPSVVETSDAGGGIGYTGLRVRGSDATRTNITLDGVPINDSESQAVYWVNMPDLVNSVSTIQIQRGVGTSTNGAGAFGATVNLATAPAIEAGIRYDGAVGAFSTYRNALSFSTGLMKNGLVMDGRLSGINSDGYVDRASSRLGSSFLSLAWMRNKTSVRLKVINGRERTYQSWYGIPESFLSDPQNRTYNPAGQAREGTPYENQVDNYGQNHVHLTLNHAFSEHWSLNTSLHYTRGKGYYEEYRAAEKLGKLFTGRTDTTDLVRRLWLDNHFYGTVFSIKYQKDHLENAIGGGWNRYDGQHYGQVIWTKKDASFEKNQPRFYESQAAKTDFNLYDKFNYALVPNTLNGFIDLQYRYISHFTEGGDRRKRDIGRDLDWHFFNPKVGLVHFFGVRPTGNRLYASFAVANREPSRNDITDAEKNTVPKSERLYNTEIGTKFTVGSWWIGANFYSMEYKNQLVVTGQINDVGEQLRVNVPKSYRRGVELELAYEISKSLIVNGNATFSQNKAQNFTEYRDNWDTFGQDIVQHGTTNLAFSPNTIGNLEMTYTLVKNALHELSLTPSVKYVSRQYLDNTSSPYTVLSAYNFTNFQIFYRLNRWKFIKNLTGKLLINNTAIMRGHIVSIRRVTTHAPTTLMHV